MRQKITDRNGDSLASPYIKRDHMSGASFLIKLENTFIVDGEVYEIGINAKNCQIPNDIILSTLFSASYRIVLIIILIQIIILILVLPPVLRAK